MRISDWSSDVCSSDLDAAGDSVEGRLLGRIGIDMISDQDHNSRLEQIVVERAQELRREQGQEAAAAQQPEGSFHEIEIRPGRRARSSRPLIAGNSPASNRRTSRYHARRVFPAGRKLL